MRASSVWIPTVTSPATFMLAEVIDLGQHPSSAIWKLAGVNHPVQHLLDVPHDPSPATFKLAEVIDLGQHPSSAILKLAEVDHPVQHLLDVPHEQPLCHPGNHF
ncbi:hypothetical protein PGTUg99_002294 [Puccinia graminis f. sp. tritici]|uniref:Uncharacterized protein n=1 Tax=Puccinia graminis f. sp. tritici TaxID=56615 RepID=A0A5B0QVC6_PUCGR|nr:hypothetical protein PGTUg99_002294 [Puccinia graminis f. sp. tritici]